MNHFSTSFYRQILPVFFLFFLYKSPVLAQCGTVIDEAAYQELYSYHTLKRNARVQADAFMSVPIKIHVIQNTDGSEGVKLEDIYQGIMHTNHFFAPIGIQFYVCGSVNYIKNSNWTTLESSTESEFGPLNDVVDVINIYYGKEVKSNGKVYAGYAYLPGGKLRIIMSNASAASKGVLPHEMGHFWGLLHTFNNSDHPDMALRELVTRGVGANCATAGDFFCDTPADPFVDGTSLGISTMGCQVNTGSLKDAQGNSYKLSAINIMSYYNCDTSVLSSEQLQHMQSRKGDANRSTWTCNGPLVAAPTNLTTQMFKMGIKLTWVDNATNEMAYQVERSTNANGPFTALGMVASNVTTYSDPSFSPFTTYYYRVKPINASGAYSNVATYTTAKDYCVPIHRSPCNKPDSYNMGITDFRFEGEVMFRNNTECEPDGFSFFQTKQTTLYKGYTYFAYYYPILHLDYSTSSGYTGMWIDLNDNGLFTDLGEFFPEKDDFITGSEFYVHIPKTVANGVKRMRVRTFNKSTHQEYPLNCCSNEYQGESEDYLITITEKPTNLPVTLSGSYQDQYKVQLTWANSSLPSNTKCFVQKAIGLEGYYEYLDTVTLSKTKYMDFNITNGNYYYQLRKASDSSLVSTIASVEVKNYLPPFTLQAQMINGIMQITWVKNGNYTGDVKVGRYQIPKWEGSREFIDVVPHDKLESEDGFINGNASFYYYKLYSMNNEPISNADTAYATRKYCKPTFNGVTTNCTNFVKYFYLYTDTTAVFSKYEYDFFSCSNGFYYSDATPYQLKHATLTKGNTYKMGTFPDYNCENGINTGTKDYEVRVFIDYNKDLNFSNDEIVYTKTGDYENCQKVFRLKIPETAKNGFTRIRIIVGNKGTVMAGGCDNYTTAYATDMFIKIQSANPTGLEEEANIRPDVVLYPNPSMGEVNIQTHSTIGKVMVYSASGTLVKVTKGDKIIGLPSGFYLVHVYSANGINPVVKSLVIQ